MTQKIASVKAPELHELQHVFIGPTWMRDEHGRWILPEFTLGWQIAGWCAEYLHSVAGDAEGHEPFMFTNEQLRFVLWWYATDERGRFIYRTGVLQRLKGWGKDPLLAVLCMVELCGPSQFSHFGNDGQPVGTAHPRAFVQVTAVSQHQTDNTMDMFPAIISDKLRRTYGIKDTAEIIRANNGRQKLVAVTSNYRALEGKRTTFTLLNETHHWVAGNKGHQMYETIDGNATKVKGRYLAITNAYLPGEDSVGERMREAYNKIADGKVKNFAFLYDSIEADPRTPLTAEALRVVVPIIRGDSVWLDVEESIIPSVMNLTMSPSRSRRMWLNQIVTDEDSLYGPEDWLPLHDEDAFLHAGDEIVVGFDGGKTDDDTALVAIRVSDHCAFVLGHWHKPEGPAGEQWEVNREEVDSRIHETFRTYKVIGFYADVALWESYVSDWSATYGEGLSIKAEGRDSISWDMRSSQKRNTLAHERLLRTILDGKIRHDGDRDLRRHVLNARRRDNNFGVGFGKESRESPRKVDLYAALMLANECLHDFRTRGKKTKTRTGRGYFL